MEHVREQLKELIENSNFIADIGIAMSEDADVKAAKSLWEAIQLLNGEYGTNPHWNIDGAKRALEAESLTVFYEQMLDRIAERNIFIRDCSCNICMAAKAEFN